MLALTLTASGRSRHAKRWRPNWSGHVLLCAALAAALGAVLAWFGPPGTDFAAHVYQRSLFLRHGFTLWDNFWYAGRYSFIDYSLLYYPLAAFLGIRVLAVLSVATAALSFAAVAAREWGPAARWSSRSFAIVWAGFLISAAFPFALGFALALLALWALQTGHHWRFAVLTLLTLTASPVALVLLAVVIAGVATARRNALDRTRLPAFALGGALAVEVVLLRLFPGTGVYPFSPVEATVALAFCVVGFASVWRVENARVLQFVFATYAATVLVVYLVPSGLGENIARFRYIAVPLALLIVALRRWRPLPVAVVLVGLALAWNAAPLAAGLVRGESDATAKSGVWRAPITYLRAHLQPGYRVEAVDTTEHWPAFYLAEAGIPLVRGWFRQDDYPFDAILYRHLTAGGYQRWLRRLSAAYVVLTRSPPDYSSRQEAALVRSGRLGLRRVWSSREISIYAVPRPSPIVTGPGHPTLLALRESGLLVRVTRGGIYHLAVRWSAYWHASTGCVSRAHDGMLRLRTNAAAEVRIAFEVDPRSLLDAFAGTAPTCALQKHVASHP